VLSLAAVALSIPAYPAFVLVVAITTVAALLFYEFANWCPPLRYATTGTWVKGTSIFAPGRHDARPVRNSPVARP